MANDNMKSMVLSCATRFAIWILPPQRKDWAEAMINEAAYIESWQQVLRWIFGSALGAMKARTSYEMERTFMTRGFLKTSLTFSAVIVVALIGVYAIQKPYQRERIKLVILHHIEGSSMAPAGSVR